MNTELFIDVLLSFSVIAGIAYAVFEVKRNNKTHKA
jgi:hypothetical protein